MACFDFKSLSNLIELYELVGHSKANVQSIMATNFKAINARGSEWPKMVYSFDIESIGDFVLKYWSGTCQLSFSKIPVLVPSDPEILRKLKTYGFRVVTQWVEMCYDIPNHIWGVSDEGLFIGRVSSELDLQEWVHIVDQELFGSKGLDLSIFSYLRQAGADLVLVRIGGIAISTALIFYDSQGVAGIYMVCVSKQFRKRGVGKRLMRYCFDVILLKGIKKCVLQATAEGVHLYESLGFFHTGSYYLLMKVK